MGTLNTTGLSDLANITFEQFKALDSIGQNRARVYYMRLKLEAETAKLTNTISTKAINAPVILRDRLSRFFCRSSACDCAQ